MERVAVVGLGAVGEPVARHLASGKIPGLLLAGVCSRGGKGSWQGVPHVTNIGELLALRPHVVVEAAGVDAFRLVVPQCLAAGCDVLAVSVAAMADPQAEQAVLDAHARGGGRVHFASGAVAALDAISAAREDGLETVTVIQRKPAHALLDETEAATLTAARTLSSTSAREAALRFPRNSNVAAAVALAGLGLDATRVDVVADPDEKHNVVEVHAVGRFGELRLVMRNRPNPANPRTALIPPMSVLAALRRRHGAFAIPA